ncbi:AAA family ATPase [Candidatus Bathyarchaeota archaeon]|nr:AAA family ATPase [Candidatus Bathyarchaeota archaeon]
MLIREIILENFMSYEYARIPLKPGLNVICGPNGAGKSSIVLAISVALGQSYTERSRKLSDLIRWGKDSARVTLVFDNTPLKGRRPVPRFDVDYFRVSRYIKRDGNYWFEANFEPVNKNEISDILSDFGLNPDNMLIIMHQNMMEEFGMTTPQQKLRMVEDAIGLGQYRYNILEAQQKLEQVLSEERSIKSLLDNAEQTLIYWKGEYGKYQQQQKLLKEKEYLERELVWARIIKQESILRSWELRIKRREEELAGILAEIGETERSVAFLDASLKELRQKYLESFYTLLNQEKERVLHETTAEVLERNLQRLDNMDWNPSLESYARNSRTFEKIFTEMKDDIASSLKLAKERESKATKSRAELTKLEDKKDSTTQEYLETRVRAGVLEFRQMMIKEAIVDLTRELHTARRALDDLEPLVEKASPRIETSRTIQEVSEDLKVLGVRLNTLGEVSQEVEKMYFNYLNILEELKTKAAIVDGNLKKTMEEIEERRTKWRETMDSILDNVSQTYQEFLTKIEAVGRVRLVNAQDIEEAGLELLIGFRGAQPQILDSFTQSGGERSVTTMLFLLALQQYLRSPFRAVDEFDVHMDPRNREVISEMLLNLMSRTKDTQYVTITPGQITAVEGETHVITVQSVLGRSEVMVVG